LFFNGEIDGIDIFSYYYYYYFFFTKKLLEISNFPLFMEIEPRKKIRPTNICLKVPCQSKLIIHLERRKKKGINFILCDEQSKQKCRFLSGPQVVFAFQICNHLSLAEGIILSFNPQTTKFTMFTLGKGKN